MLSRPEIGSREHILLWLASKPEDETFVWRYADTCACGQYSLHYTGDARAWNLGNPFNTEALDELNIAAHGLMVLWSRRSDRRGERPVRFGDLYREMRELWAT